MKDGSRCVVGRGAARIERLHELAVSAREVCGPPPCWASSVSTLPGSRQSWQIEVGGRARQAGCASLSEANPASWGEHGSAGALELRRVYLGIVAGPRSFRTALDCVK